MSEDTPTLDTKTPIGRALMMQALSAILIMGTIVLPVLTLEAGFIWFADVVSDDLDGCIEFIVVHTNQQGGVAPPEISS